MYVCTDVCATFFYCLYEVSYVFPFLFLRTAFYHDSSRYEIPFFLPKTSLHWCLFPLPPLYLLLVLLLLSCVIESSMTNSSLIVCVISASIFFCNVFFSFELPFLPICVASSSRFAARLLISPPFWFLPVLVFLLFSCTVLCFQ